MWAPLLLVLLARQAATQDAQQPRAQRWAAYGEPYQERVVSIIPGTAQHPPWPPINPQFPWSNPEDSWPPSQGWSPLASPPISSLWPSSPASMSPNPWSPAPMQAVGPLWSSSPAPLTPNSYPWPPAPPMQSAGPLWSSPPASLTPNSYPWSPSPPMQSPGPFWPPTTSLQPPSLWPPVSYGAPVAILGPQESSSRDLDVGVYTGMDAPWTQLPPFSRTSQVAPRGPLRLQTSPWESSSRDLDVGVYTGDDVVSHQPPAWPPYQAPTWLPPRAPYPWMRQQGGFAVKRADDDLKLTMHVPKDGLPGGVLVMEMKASVYRPVY